MEITTEKDIIDSNSLGTFYKFVNKRLSYRNVIGTLVDDDGNFITSDDEKANLFNNYFGSVGVVDNNASPVCYSVLSNDCSLETVEFTAHNVGLAMKKLKSSLSCGPDGLPPLLFKHLRYCLAEPLALMYTQLLSVSAVPPEWKQAVITPVFKKGTAGDVSNYRPISLTCVPSKIMEHVIARKIYEHFKFNNILHRSQHGFCKGRSTCTNLLESLNDWTLTIHYMQSVTIAYIDFSKAFDSVSHEKLFTRLTSYGIRGSLLEWLREFFRGRTHQTRVGNSLSEIVELLSGVVQGSGIGPVLFLAFINELAEILEHAGVYVKLFADDVKLYLNITSSCDADKLQHALNLLVQWAQTWQLTVSVNKCCILNVGKSRYAPRDFYLDGAALSCAPLCRDLGVIVSEDLKPTAHIKQMVAKAHQRSNAILRSFVSRDIDLLVRAFSVYVLPLLEYNSVVWSPQSVQDIELVERVQRRFTKCLPGLKPYTYARLLEHLKLPNLELRRLHANLVWCYPIYFNLVDINFDDFFTFSAVTNTSTNCTNCILGVILVVSFLLIVL